MKLLTIPMHHCKYIYIIQNNIEGNLDDILVCLKDIKEKEMILKSQLTVMITILNILFTKKID